MLVSGGIAVGKTTVGRLLAVEYDGTVVRVRDALATVLGIAADDRQTLQIEGAALDKRTRGTWLVDFLDERIEPGSLVIVDALRTRRQTQPILDRVADSHLVHLLAHESTRRRRYAEAALKDQLKAGVPYDQAVSHETERSANEVQDLAELALPTDDLSPAATVKIIAQHLGLAGRTASR